MSCVAIIPARGGSQRIPGKNKRPFFGRPIIAYSIDAAIGSGLFDRVIVSSDDHEILSIAEFYDAEAMPRPTEWARNEVGTQEVTANVLREIWAKTGKLPDLACCIYPTAPLMCIEHLAVGHTWVMHNNRMFSFSVGTEPLADAGQFYWGWAPAFTNNVPLLGPNTAMIPIDKSRVCDINTMEDWTRAEEMYKLLMRNPLGT